MRIRTGVFIVVGSHESVGRTPETSRSWSAPSPPSADSRRARQGAVPADTRPRRRASGGAPARRARETHRGRLRRRSRRRRSLVLVRRGSERGHPPRGGLPLVQAEFLAQSPRRARPRDVRPRVSSSPHERRLDPERRLARPTRPPPRGRHHRRLRDPLRRPQSRPRRPHRRHQMHRAQRHRRLRPIRHTKGRRAPTQGRPRAHRRRVHRTVPLRH